VKSRTSGILPDRVTFRRTALLLLLTALVTTGCGERAEPVGSLSVVYPVRVLGGGDAPTVLRRAPKRIVALDLGAVELLSRMGVGARLVGLPSGAPVPAGAKAQTVVAPSGQIDVQGIVSLRPDLIIATPDTDPVDVSRAERESRAALYIQPSESVDDVARSAIELGFLVAEPAKARVLVAEMRRSLADLDATLADVPMRTVFVDTGLFVTVPTRSLLGDLIRRAQGQSVAGPRPGLEPFPLGRLAQLDPDVYLATSDTRLTLARLRSNPKTKRLRSVREGRVHILPVTLVTTAGPLIPYRACAGRWPRTGSSGRTPMSATPSPPRSTTTSPARTTGAIRRRLQSSGGIARPSSSRRARLISTPQPSRPTSTPRSSFGSSRMSSPRSTRYRRPASRSPASPTGTSP
jgi:iron complex transport system substrate-binding protein